MESAVFLDRDGTINVEKNHMYKIEDWEWIPGSIEAIKGFNRLGFLVIIVTNQSGIARGLYTLEDLLLLKKFIDTELSRYKAFIDGFYYCPHHPDYGAVRDCSCRKPKPGMLIKAQKDFEIDMASSYIIGDKLSDMSAGLSAGTAAILVKTGYGSTEIKKLENSGAAAGITTADNLYEAYELIKARLFKPVI